MKHIFLLFIGITLIACNGSKTSSASGPAVDLTGFSQTKINGSNTSYAMQTELNGSAMLSEGMVDGNVQHGLWMTYHPDETNKVHTITNYVNGVMNGPYMEFNKRGQIEKRVTYLNNQIHGLYAEYKFGRPLKEYIYDNGVLNGVSKEYSDRGKLVKETSYKNGELHGTTSQYDEEGNVVLQYEYKNGNKISGGIVPKSE